MFRVGYRSQTCSLSAAPQMTTTELMSEIQILAGLFASRRQISSVYPPQQIPTGSIALVLTVADLSVKCRGPFTVSERSQSPTPTHAKSWNDDAAKVGIAGDNCCLFNAIG
jgi:hypothetical protein